MDLKFLPALLVLLVPTSLAAWTLWDRFELIGIYQVADEPLDVELSDVDRDGNLDALVASRAGKALSVLIGLGNGNLVPLSPIELPGGVTSVTTADINWDERIDAIATVCNHHCTENSVAVLSGRGNGEFDVSALFKTSGVPYNVLVGEFTGDDLLDIAASDYPAGSVLLLTGRPDGTFAEKVYRSDAGTIALEKADLNGDGLADLLAVNQKAGTVSAFLMSRSGLSPARSTPVDALPYAAAICRLDADSVPDLAVAHSSSPGKISLWRGGGDGNFYPLSTIELPDRLIFVACAELNGDGLEDVVVTFHQSEEAQGFLNDGRGGLDALHPITIDAQNKIYSADVGDLNSDRLPDLVTADFEANTVSVSLGRESH